MMSSCPFCEIIEGKKSAYKVYEDDEFVAFLDIRPLTRGNTLVVTKKHVRWVDEVENFGAYFEVAQKVGLAAKKALGAIWVCYLTLGTEVPHAHIRVIPRYADDRQAVVPSLEIMEQYTKEEMTTIADKIKSEIGGV
jgi:histidine triad (HIT) family protein